MTGSDKLGHMVQSFLKKNHVNVEYISEFTGNTRLALAYLDKNNNADYSFYQDPGHIFRTRIPDFRPGDILLHGSSFSLKKENHIMLKELISACKQNQVLIHYDPNFRMVYKKKLNEILPFIIYNFKNADIIKGSNEDFEGIFGTTDLDSAFSKINESGNKILIYTMGGEGMWMKTRNMEIFIEVEKIKPVSTIGAGDTLNAGILYGLIKMGATPENIHTIKETVWRDILNRAAKFSAEVCLSLDNYLPANKYNS
jgi:fructokinase